MQANERGRDEQSYEENASGPGVVAAVDLADTYRDGSQKLWGQRVMCGYRGRLETTGTLARKDLC